MTPDQLKDIEREKRLIIRTTSASLMNNTKWRKLFSGFVNKVVTDVPVRYKYINSGAIYGPSYINWREIVAEGNFKLIEWFELHYSISIHIGSVAGSKVVNHRGEIISYLKSIHVGFTEDDDKVIIPGYKKSV
jgi:hypothetical protein